MLLNETAPRAGTILKAAVSGRKYVVLPIDYPAEEQDLILVRIEDNGRLCTRAFYRSWKHLRNEVVKTGSWEGFLPLARQMPISNRMFLHI